MNLSWNNLTDFVDLRTKPLRLQEPLVSEEDMNKQMASIMVKRQKKLPFEQQDSIVYLAFCLTRFIKQNKNLVHLDLSHT